jgi:hypothetical protein
MTGPVELAPLARSNPAGGGEVVGRPATELRTRARRIHEERACHWVGRRPREDNCLNAPEPVA